MSEHRWQWRTLRGPALRRALLGSAWWLASFLQNLAAAGAVVVVAPSAAATDELEVLLTDAWASQDESHKLQYNAKVMDNTAVA